MSCRPFASQLVFWPPFARFTTRIPSSGSDHGLSFMPQEFVKIRFLMNPQTNAQLRVQDWLVNYTKL